MRTTVAIQTLSLQIKTLLQLKYILSDFHWMENQIYLKE